MAWRGVSKSGSPIASEMTSLPSARSSRARIDIWMDDATCVRFSRCARAGMMSSVQACAESLDARAGLAQRFLVGRVADAEVAGVAERGAMHGGDTLLLQQRGDERLVVVDLGAALAGLADATVHARIDVERAFRLVAVDAGRGVQHLDHHVAALLVLGDHRRDGILRALQRLQGGGLADRGGAGGG